MSDQPGSSSSPLPAPRGDYGVGRVALDLVDPARRETYSPTGSTDVRELVIWVWYPAERVVDARRADYLPAPWLPAAQFLGLDVAGLRSHAVTEAQPVLGTQRFPVLLLSPSGFPPLFLATLAEDVASHGFVVVGINHTYETTVTVFSDGRVVPVNPAAVGGALGQQSGSYAEAFRARAEVCRSKAADLAFVANELVRLDDDQAQPFAGRLDLDRLGALGHSFGGVAAMEWCSSDIRCRAAVNLDGAVWTELSTLGVPRPVLQILADHPEFALPAEEAVAAGAAPSTDWFDAERAITFDGWRGVHEHSNPSHTVQVSGASHLSFMDVPHLPLADGALVAAMLGGTSIAPERMSRLTADLVLAFFDCYLHDATTSLLDGPSPDYPEVHYGPP